MTKALTTKEILILNRKGIILYHFIGVLSFLSLCTTQKSIKTAKHDGSFIEKKRINQKRFEVSLTLVLCLTY